MIDQNGTKILFVVDDEPDFREFVVTVASRAGWDAVEISSAGQMVTRIRDGIRPDAIFLDLLMPEKDGIELLMETSVREVAGKVPIYVVTGGMAVNAAAANLIGKGMGLNIVETIYKPIPIGKIKEILARH